MRQCYWCGESVTGVHVCPNNEGDDMVEIQIPECPNTYIWGYCIACGRTAEEGCILETYYDCPACQDTGRVPTDDPLSPDGKAQCPECTIE